MQVRFGVIFERDPRRGEALLRRQAAALHKSCHRYQFRRSGASSIMEGAFCLWLVRGDSYTSPSLNLAGLAVTETCRHDLRQRETRVTSLLTLLGAWPRGRRRIRTSYRPGLWAARNARFWLIHEDAAS